MVKFQKINPGNAVKVLFAALFVVAIFSSAHAAEAASLYFSPSSATFSAGRTFNVSVYVSSADTAMNAAQGTVSFPANKIEVVSVSKSGSVMNLWVQEPSFSNRDGIINFAGVAVNPGFQGGAGKVITITFRANSIGKANLSFLSGSVLANDGSGTNILGSMGTATININEAPPAPVPVEAIGIPQPTIDSVPSIGSVNWYNIDSIQLNWKLPSGIDGVEYGISQNPDYPFSKNSNGLVSQVSYDLKQFTDGAWYFAMRFKKGNEWGPSAIKAFHLDRTSPEPFTVKREDGDLTGKQPVFSWNAEDKSSGVAYYQIKIGEGDWFDAASIIKDLKYVLPEQLPTYSRTLVVRAYDNAGNHRDSSISFQVLPTTGVLGWWYRLILLFSEWGWTLMVILVALIASLYFLIFRLMLWRRKVREEIKEFKAELRHDLKMLEGRIKNESEKGMEVDLRPSNAEKARNLLQKEVEHIEEDIKKEVKKLDNLKGV